MWRGLNNFDAESYMKGCSVATNDIPYISMVATMLQRPPGPVAGCHPDGPRQFVIWVEAEATRPTPVSTEVCRRHTDTTRGVAGALYTAVYTSTFWGVLRHGIHQRHSTWFVQSHCRVTRDSPIFSLTWTQTTTINHLRSSAVLNWQISSRNKQYNITGLSRLSHQGGSP